MVPADSDGVAFQPPQNLDDTATRQAGQARKGGRLKPLSLRCELGQVIDISGGGMRVKVKGKLKLEKGETFPLVIHAPEGEIRVKCKVVWTRKADWRSIEIGLQFDDVAPESRAMLNLVARGIAAEGYVLRHADDTKF